jgi:hypothetical protein
MKPIATITFIFCLLSGAVAQAQVCNTTPGNGNNKISINVDVANGKATVREQFVEVDSICGNSNKRTVLEWQLNGDSTCKFIRWVDTPNGQKDPIKFVARTPGLPSVDSVFDKQNVQRAGLRMTARNTNKNNSTTDYHDYDYEFVVECNGQRIPTDPTIRNRGRF